MGNIEKKKKWLSICGTVACCILLTACQNTVPTDTKENVTDDLQESAIEIVENLETTTPEYSNSSYTDDTEEKTDDTLYTEPPVMTISYENSIISVPANSYEWYYQDSKEEDTWSGVVADAPHPLDQNFFDRILFLDPTNSVHEISMYFDITPASLEVLTYWPAPKGADVLPSQSMPAPDEEIDYDSGIPYENTADITEPNVFLAFEGKYIYEIYATFEADTYHGGAYYTILITDDLDSMTEHSPDSE